MKFIFVLKQTACCGGQRNGEIQLDSATYHISTETPAASVVKAFDSFVASYHQTPVGLKMQPSEIQLLQQTCPTEFSLSANKVFFRRLPVTVCQ